jgi:hypothetical protein
MARARPAPPTPGQLSLDDWAESVTSEARASAPRRAAENRSDRSASCRVAHNEREVRATDLDGAMGQAVRHQRAATALLATPEAMLTRTHLRELGLERRAVDAVFRALPVVALPGYSRPMVRVEDYLELVACNTFRDDRVRPISRAS